MEQFAHVSSQLGRLTKLTITQFRAFLASVHYEMPVNLNHFWVTYRKLVCVSKHIQYLLCARHGAKCINYFIYLVT